MKILHLSTSDRIGGAARATYRLHQALQRIDSVRSQILVQSKSSDDPNVISPQTVFQKSLAKIGHALDEIPPRLLNQQSKIEFSTQWIPDQIRSQIFQINPDIINIHWINESYVKIETIGRLNKPIVWTLHDMWAFTGGCHYDQNCGRYINSCGSCPQLNSHSNFDLSRWIWERKSRAWKNTNLTIVTPSSWLAKLANSSSLFQSRRIEVIPNGIDIQQYYPHSRHILRSLLNLPQDKKLVLFGAINATSAKRKGFHLLQPALYRLSESGWQNQIELVIIGASQPEEQIDLAFKTHYLGKLRDDISLAQVYGAVDVFVAPSLQDNLPNTVMEALACGTPCVAFQIGGMPDMIEHQKNGYLAQAFDIDDFAQGIAWVLGNQEIHQKLCDRAREKAEKEFSLEIQARRYMSLYNQLM